MAYDVCRCEPVDSCPLGNGNQTNRRGGIISLRGHGRAVCDVQNGVLARDRFIRLSSISGTREFVRHGLVGLFLIRGGTEIVIPSIFVLLVVQTFFSPSPSRCPFHVI